MRDEGEGEGDSLCLPLLDGKGDLKEDGGGRLGADGTVNGLGLYMGPEVEAVGKAAPADDVDALDEVDAVRVDDDDELDARVRGWNQLAGRFNPFALGTLNPVDPDPDPDGSSFPLDIVHGPCLVYQRRSMNVGDVVRWCSV